MKKALLPAGWIKPRGYANGVAAAGTQVFIAGQIGWDEQARFQTTDFAHASAFRRSRTCSPCCTKRAASPSIWCA